MTGNAMRITPLGVLAICVLSAVEGGITSVFGPLTGYLDRAYGVGPEGVGIALSVKFAGSLIGMLLTIFALERRPVRGPMVIASVVGCAGLVVCLLGVSWPVLLTGIFLAGGGFAAVTFGTMQVLAHAAGTRGPMLLNLSGAVFGAGAMAAPMLAVQLPDARLPMLVGGGLVLGLIGLVSLQGLSGTLPSAPREAGGFVRGIGLTPVVGGFVLAYICYIGTESGIAAWLPTHLTADGMALETAATFATGFWGATIVGRVVSGVLSRWLPVSAILLGSGVLICLAIGLTTIPAVAPLAYVLVGVGVGPVYPCGVAWLAELEPGRPRTTSWLLMSAMIGGVVFPPLVGSTITAFGTSSIPAVLGVLAIGSVASFAVAGLVIARRAATARRSTATA
ncbi:MFS transporter [Allokutzneria oryzae]|uniref:Sugar MFS transporter n=1 Tax=Allokutzneria oryzae TaxID=1378989 RepID=A0ABV5ZUQ4_9PSEU